MDKTALKNKIENYWYHYKWHTIIVVVIVIAIIGSSAIGGAKLKKYDFNAILIGTYLEDSKKTQIEEQGKVNIEFLPAGKNVDNELSSISLQKLTAMTTIGSYDVIILDKEFFDSYAKQGFFLELDNIIAPHTLKDKTLNYMKANSSLDNKEHTYGVELKKNKHLEDAKYDVTNKVIGISAKTKAVDKAVNFINFITESK